MKPIPIQEIEGTDLSDFKTKFLKTQTPVVIRRHPDVVKAMNKWTPEFLERTCGDVDVDIFDNGFDNSASAYTKPNLKMKFADYFKTITKNEESTYRIFLFNMFKHRPALRKDFACPSVFKGIMDRIGFMFFGARGIKVRIHQDMDMSNVLLSQFYGHKKVVLISPQQSTLLYRLPLNTHSLIDLDHPDYDKYPALRYVQPLECVLDPGDTLFIPSGYWHYITYLDGGFSVSYRKMAVSMSAKLEGFLNVAVYMPLDKLMNAIAGTRWFAWKVKRAEKLANRAMREADIQRQRPSGNAPVREAVPAAGQLLNSNPDGPALQRKNIWDPHTGPTRPGN